MTRAQADRAYRQLDDERKIVLLERYASHDAFATHRETPHFKELVINPLIRAPERLSERIDQALSWR